MVAEVVSIGTELLLGQIVDTDAPYLAQQLSALGINVYFRQTVGDNFERAVQTVRQAVGRADLVLLVGGLGPTMDDLTRDIIAEVMDAPLQRDSAIARGLEAYFAARGARMVETVLRQADVPAGATPLPNANGTAPGLLLEKNRKIIVALPGPPSELIPMFAASVYPVLREWTSGDSQAKFAGQAASARQVIRSRVLRIVDMGESLVEEAVRDLMQESNPTVAPYAKTGEVHLRVTARGATETEADRLTRARADLLRERLGDVVYGEDETTLEQAVVELLQERRKTVATAESCTGGLLAGRLTSVPGASEVFHTGLVTYANEAKIHLLKVPSSLIDRFGAVSSEVARSMAERVRELARTDYGISITGIAGPGGGTPEKPVGLVHIGFADANGVIAQRNLFGGQRADIRLRTTQTALNLLRRALLKT